MPEDNTTPALPSATPPQWLVDVRARAEKYGPGIPRPGNAQRAACDRSDLLALLDLAARVSPAFAVMVNMTATELGRVWASEEVGS